MIDGWNIPPKPKNEWTDLELVKYGWENKEAPTFFTWQEVEDAFDRLMTKETQAI